MTRRHRLRAENFARRLVEARERAGLTQLDLARRCGYETRQAISELERETIGVTTARCAEIARALGVSAPWLAFGVEAEGEPVTGQAATGEEAAGYGDRLRTARLAAKVSQKALATALGYAGNSAVANLEGETRGLEIGQAEVIGRILGVSAAWLAYGVES